MSFLSALFGNSPAVTLTADRSCNCQCNANCCCCIPFRKKRNIVHEDDCEIKTQNVALDLMQKQDMDLSNHVPHERK